MQIRNTEDAMQLRDKFLKARRSAFTMVELCISFGIATVVLYMAFKFMTSTRFHFMHGTVNLQNLGEIRLAINYLRRDFSSACPYLSKADNPQVLINFRNRPFNAGNLTDGLNSRLVDINPAGNKLTFHRFKFETADGDSSPEVQEITYEYDSTKKVLVRTCEGNKTTFKGFEGVEFKFFLSPFNEKVPILFVKMVAHEGKDQGGANVDIGKPVELTASIASAFMSTYYSNKTWNFQTTHTK